MKKKIYIAGPMRGYKNFNRDAFAKAEERMRKLGFEVFNPIVEDDKHGISTDSETGTVEDMPGFTMETFKSIIKRDVDGILDCQAIYLLRGWTTSKGAKAEAAIAKWWNIPEVFEVMADYQIEEVLSEL